MAYNTLAGCNKVAGNLKRVIVLCSTRKFFLRHAKTGWHPGLSGARSTLFRNDHFPTVPLSKNAALTFAYQTTLNRKRISLQHRNFSASTQCLSLKRDSKNFVTKLAYKFDDWLASVSPAGKKYADMLTAGARVLWADLKIYFVVRNKLRMDPNAHTTYNEEMVVHSTNRDFIKMAPLLPILMMPFGFFLLILPVSLFPRYVLPLSFWTKSQRITFFQQIHQERALYYGIILNHMNYHKLNYPNPNTRYILDDICNTVTTGSIPTNFLLKSFKPLCKAMESPFNLDNTVDVLLSAFCRTVMVSPYQPSSWKCHRLRKNANLILSLDDKIRKENLLHKLSHGDIKIATLMRGLNSAALSYEANVYWLENWLKLSQNCDGGDVWFLLHAMVLLSTNYTELKYKRKVFG
ncbi:unnamed protein product [Clavelina lepadiformis]|uniref:Letm1 RBD domain-containing protein n=1 Tax=Clavelina lepadiformis TaxID=159417 RepID=A0ABP0FPJ5_CLALP